jgi:ketosteroid isomerase-like protein
MTRVLRTSASVVRRLFEAVETRDVEPMYGLYAPDVVIHEAPSLPWGGEFRGHDGVLRHGLGYVRTWEPLQTAADRRLDPEVAAEGDRVFVTWRQRAHDRDGRQLDLPAVSAYALASGRIVDARMYHFDTVAILAFLAAQTRPEESA